MSFPIGAFVKSKGEDVPKGGLFFAKGNWWFRSDFVVPTGIRKNILSLAGPQAGGIGKVDNGYGLTLAPGYAWELRIKDPCDSAFSDTPKSGTIVVNEDGAPHIWGHIMGVTEHRHGFTLAGDLVPMFNEMEGHPYLHHTAYQVWLIDPQGQTVDSGPIFETASA